MRNLFKILKYAVHYKGYAALNILFNLLSTVFSLFSLTMIIPFLDLIFLQDTMDYQRYMDAGAPRFEMTVAYMKDIFYYTFAQQITSGGGKMSALLWLCAIIIVMIFLKNLCRYMAMFFIAQIRNGVIRDIRKDLFNKSVSLPLSYYSEEKKGDIIARMSNDVQEIEWTIMTSIEMLFKDPVSIIIFLATLIVMSPQLSIFVLLLLPVSGFIIGRIGKSLKETSVKGQNKMGQLISSIEEMLSGLRIIKAFNAEGVIKRKFNALNESYKKLMVRMYRKRDLSAPLSEFLGVAVLVVIIWFGGRLVLSSDHVLDASVFIAYIAIFSQLIPPSKSLTTAYYNIQKGAASEERIAVIMNADIKIKEKKDPVKIKGFEDTIEYRDVRFRYVDEDVLKNINFKITKGMTVALVGPSGAGKSTFADLLPRFYDPTSGAVFIDGIALTDCSIRHLRKLMGIVTQESILFNDTVFNNIAFGMPEVSEEDVARAATNANAHDFIVNMEKGYHTNIGDRGNKLSGGQRQRIAIARAILKNPEILILDEATSALDPESEKQVQDALDKLMKNRTSLVIAHSLSTIHKADVIIVIDKGEIVEYGSHKDLIARNGHYKKMHDLQSFN